MTEPLPQPEPPPPEPPLDLWSSLAVLAVGAALLTFVVLKMLRNSRTSSEPSGSSGDDESNRQTDESKRPKDDSTELSDGEAV